MDGRLFYVMPHEQWFDADGDPSIVATFLPANGAEEVAFQFTGPRADDRWAVPCARLTVRSDSWAVFQYLPDLFAELGQDAMSLAHVRAALDRLGADDETAREGNGPYAPALAAAQQFVRLASPDNAAKAAEALKAYAEYEEEPAF